MRILRFGLVIQLLCAALVLATALPAAQPGFSDAEAEGARTFLREHFSGTNCGMVIGLVDERGSRIVSCGRLDNGTDAEVSGDTVFEIGSVTKTFTALLLLDMVERGEMKLEDPVAKYLPKSVRMPSCGGKEITLLNLATQDSGLPFDADNLAPGDWWKAFDAYTAADLYAFLSGHSLTKDPGTKFQYSNVGMSLLGHVMELKAGTNFEALVVNRICGPLGLTNTCITLPPELKARLATGHDENGQPMPFYHLQVMAGAGALLSTANDLLKYVAAQLGLTPSSLRPLMEQTQVIRHRGAPDCGATAMPWYDSDAYCLPGAEILGHAGGTVGASTYVGFDRKQRRGVVVLSNHKAMHAAPVGITLLQGLPLTRDNFTRFRREMVGIGTALLLDPTNRALRITGVIPGSPAARAGLAADSTIQKIDGRSVEGKTLAECVELIRGEAGTSVRLELADVRRGATNTVELTRQKIMMNDVPQVSAKTVLSPEQMREDLDYTVRILSNVHPATVNGFSKEQQAAIATAHRRIQEPGTVSAFYFVVNSVICSLQDGHTRLSPVNDGQNRCLPVPILWLQDGFYVSGDGEPFHRGDRLVSIGGRDMDALYGRMRALIPAENEHFRKRSMAELIQREDYLDQLGCVKAGAVEMSVERAGKQITMSAPLTSAAPRQPWPPARRWVGYQIDTNLSLGIFHLDACRPNERYTNTVKAFFAEVAEKNVRNIAIDVRRNGGGNSSVIDEFFAYLKLDDYASFSGDARYSEEVAQQRGLTRTSGYVRGKPSRIQNVKVKDSKLLFDGKLFALTSANTFSGGNWFAVLVKDNGLGTILGEPTGNAPTSYGDVPTFQMPNTKLSFTVSHKKWNRPNPANDPADALYPDIPVYTTIEDVLRGGDPQVEKLKAIIKAPRPSSGPH